MPTNRTRARLAEVLRRASGIVTLGDICNALDVDRTQASKIAARWVTQGRLTRVRAGLFAPVPLDAEPETSAVGNPWQLIPELFGASFITGWSAAEHWHLTEQLFRRICVKTADATRGNLVSARGAEFFVVHVRADLIFGTETVWADRTRISVADPHRTIIDMLDDPRLGGGGRHAADCVRTYLQSDHRDAGALIEYGDRIGNGAVFKRLGFLVEGALGADDPIARDCRRRLTSGYADFDPAVKHGHAVPHWRLRVPSQTLTDVTR